MYSGTSKYRTLSYRGCILHEKHPFSEAPTPPHPTHFPLFSPLQTCQQKLESSIDSGNQATVHVLWNKVDTLEKLLDPSYMKTSRVSREAKEDLLLGYVSQVEAVSGQVDELQQLKDYVSTTEFQGLDAHEKKLATVARVHSQQEQSVEDISRQARELMKAYNQITLQLSAQCIEWGSRLDQAETKQ